MIVLKVFKVFTFAKKPLVFKINRDAFTAQLAHMGLVIHFEVCEERTRRRARLEV